MKWQRFLVAISAFCLIETLAYTQDQRTILVDGYRVRVLTASLDRASKGQRTVILESGGGAPLETWMPVFERIAGFAPVVAYDRPGNANGLSQSDGQLPTARHVAGR